jgi:pimeloyl-ACP methyl ester carboxylesterase
MGLDHAPTEASRAMRKAVAEPTRDNVRRMLEGIAESNRDLDDAVVDERIRRMTLPGARQANESIQRYRARVKSDPNLRQQYSLAGRLPELTIPTILIWGGRDRFAPVELGHRLCKLLPNLSAFHVFEESGHQVQHDEVERFNRTVIEFLDADVPELAENA